MLKKEEIIDKAYEVFSIFAKPKQCTKYNDLEDTKYNIFLCSVSNRNLTIEHVGTVAWGPIPSMNPEALVYFMPRLIEMAVTNEIDSDGDPFFCHFINSFYKYPNKDWFKLFGAEQRKIMTEVFNFLVNNFYEQLKIEGWLEEVYQAIENWSFGSIEKKN